MTVEVEMDSKPEGGLSSQEAIVKRKRRNGGDVALRYFLPKAGSHAGAFELGQEMASEGEALIEAFRHGQQFYTLAVWKAVPEVNGGGSPVIVKRAVAEK